MQNFKISLWAIAALFIPATHAFAFNFGFVRVPDWMDYYISVLLGVSLVSYLGVLATKPQGVPTNQLSQVKISLITNIFRFILLIAFGLLMLMVFVGMGLRRYAEA